MKKVRYLEETDLTNDGGVIKKIISKGTYDGEDCMALPGQEVVIHYEARLDNGTIVDRSINHEKEKGHLKLVVGVGNVIDGWDLGLMSMHLGEKCDLFIKSEYGYGDEGRPPLIPGKAMVIF